MEVEEDEKSFYFNLVHLIHLQHHLESCRSIAPGIHSSAIPSLLWYIATAAFFLHRSPRTRPPLRPRSSLLFSLCEIFLLDQWMRFSLVSYSSVRAPLCGFPFIISLFHAPRQPPYSPSILLPVLYSISSEPKALHQSPKRYRPQSSHQRSVPSVLQTHTRMHPIGSASAVADH
jgi:hypothetical protein